MAPTTGPFKCGRYFEACYPKSGVSIKGPRTLGFCEICQQAKQTRKISHTPMPRATRPLARIHVDIAGGGNTFGGKVQETTTSRQGSTYYMPITDDATRWRWIFFLNRKSDALSVLKWWIHGFNGWKTKGSHRLHLSVWIMSW